MKPLIAWLLLACVCLAQDPNTTIEQNSTLPKTPEQVVLPWSETGTNDFDFHGTTELVDHLRNHPMLGDELEKLHEWLHQRVEKLRPRDEKGAGYSSILIEADDAQFAAWKDRAAIEAAGWKIVRLPARKAVRNVVAIGKTHFSHAGYLTIDALKRFVNQVENRKVKPIKNARAKWVSKITMYTRQVDSQGNPVRGKCQWCDVWLDTELASALRDGAEVSYAADPYGTVPRFDVCDESGTCRQYTGFTAWTTMKASIQ